MSSASLSTSAAARDSTRAYSADLEQYHRAKAIRPVGKLAACQALPAAEAAALLAAVQAPAKCFHQSLLSTIIQEMLRKGFIVVLCQDCNS